MNLSLSEDTSAIGKFSFQKIVLVFRLIKQGVKALNQTKPDLILYNCAPLGFAFYRDVLFTVVIRMVSHAPLAFYIHGKGFQTQSESGLLYRWAGKILFRNSDAICLSEGLKEDVRLFHMMHYHALNNGIPATRIDPAPAAPRPFTFLFLSNLIQSKGVLDFIDALAVLKTKTARPFAFALIGKEFDVTRRQLLDRIGAGSLQRELLNISAEYGEEKERWLADKSDVLVLPTHNDCFPLVILEAFRAGLPVISTFQGAIPEIVKDGFSGYLVAENNPEALAGKMQELLENSSLHTQMRQHARQEYASRFTFDIFERNFIATIEDILLRHAKQ